MAGSRKLYVVVQTRPEKPEGADYFELQGVFSTSETARAACRNDRYQVWEEELDAALPDETAPVTPFWEPTPPGDLRMVEPSPETRAFLDKMILERGWHGGDRDADGGLTPDRFDVDPKQRRRYYPAACAVAWFHEAARYWALVAMLRSQGDHSDRSKEIEAMARRAYEIGYAWLKGALSGLPEYDSWQEEPTEGETA